MLGVSGAESVASGLPATQLAGGWQDASLAWSAEVHLDERWRVSGQWLRARLLGASARSPVVASRWQGSGSLTLWRAF
ncbi:MAG: hypothetical protein CFE45_29325 [Burkholderiales bacterium PBB5]|nr:MAG: hypothetical protein CFE45_29325 [Burkholderiales bacterium PBB5]